MQFVKVHGTGNDFVLLPDLDDRLELTPALVRALCDRHMGIGGDGVLRLAPATGADVFMDYRNADGSVAEMCGNGVRCVAKYLADRGHADEVILIDTRGGVKAVTVVERDGAQRARRLRVDMGAPSRTGTVEVWVDGRPQRLWSVSMGNPHVVLVTDDVAAAPLDRWGPEIASQFGDGANVEVIERAGPGRVRGRIHERGVGETLASGTGASAIAVAAHLEGLSGRETTISLPGGELEISWTDETLYVTGPAVEVAHGTVDPDWLELTERREAQTTA